MTEMKEYVVDDHESRQEILAMSLSSSINSNISK